MCSTRTITLVIDPMDLCKTIFLSLHVNPFCNYYSYYYTIYCIWLQYCWLGMAKDILSWIAVCTHCLIKTGTFKPATELLYTFPLHASMVTVHINDWVPVKIMSLNCNIIITIVMCQMTWFVAPEPFKTATSKPFATAIYYLRFTIDEGTGHFT